MGSDKVVKKKKEKLYGPKALLDEIIRAKGGPAKIARLLSKTLKVTVRRQVVANWQVRGKVPLREIGVVSEALKVSPFALNYEEYAYQVGEYPEWKSVVDGVKVLDPAVKSKLYGLPLPA